MNREQRKEIEQQLGIVGKTLAILYMEDDAKRWQKIFPKASDQELEEVKLDAYIEFINWIHHIKTHNN